jgi:Beta-galactosidase/beta-glucuronidase
MNPSIMRFFRASVAGLGIVVCATNVGAQRPPRERISIDDGWRFHRNDPSGDRDLRLSYDSLKAWILPTGNSFIRDSSRWFARPGEGIPATPSFARADFDDSQWQRVDLPHDWAIAGPFITQGGPGGGMGRLPSPGVGWYRRKLDIPASDSGRSIFLDVDGAMSYSSVWVNGRLVGGWPFGYASWRVDLTPYLVPGAANQLAIRLDNPPSSSRWYPGGGIYRDVWLTKTALVHVGQWGTYVRTRNVSRASATVDLDVSVDNASTRNAPVTVSTRIYALDARGKRTASPVASIAPAKGSVPAGATLKFSGSVAIAHPRLWGPPPTQQPNRYEAVTEVAQAGTVVDRYETRFGIREIRYTGDSGVFVNGEHVYLKGVNEHHDFGALGAAFNRSAAERKLAGLRELGANAIRMSHNPPAPELLALTDSLGFLVMDEAFDVWERQKTPFDFHLVFPEWHEQDLRAMLRRDRNHPSVILWSIGNEVGEQMTGEAGAAIARELVSIVRQEDSRPATTAMNWSQPNQPLPGVVDVISLNYQGAGIRAIPGKYPDFHAAFPNKLILGSEVAAALSARGAYLFPVSSAISGPVRQGSGGDSVTHQVSAYELYAADFGSSADRVFASQDRNPYVGGEFVWTGWDYLGEPTPYYSSRSSYFGIFDLAGFRKDRFYLYQAHWRPELPMAHILPHWTWPERVGQVTPVHVFTSGDEAELFLNGKSLGKRKRGEFEYRLRWDSVRYEPGTLEVVAYKNGKRWATDRVATAGAASRLEATPDRSTIRADGRDLAFVSVRVLDAKGTLVPRANETIRFTVEGPGEIVATDSGDPTDMTAFPSHERRAFNGMALVIVRAKPGEHGRIVVTASANGVQSGKAVVDATTP